MAWGFEEEAAGDVVYVCIRCGKAWRLSELIQSTSGLVCPNCGSRIFVKPRTPLPNMKPRKVYAD